MQSFSADWHADTFAGATVRRISRAMWGYDVVSDAVIAWIGPALIVLAVLSVTLMLRWPLIGAFSLAMVVDLHRASPSRFSNLYVLKAQPPLGGARIRASAARWPTRSLPTRR